MWLDNIDNVWVSVIFSSISSVALAISMYVNVRYIKLKLKMMMCLSMSIFIRSVAKIFGSNGSLHLEPHDNSFCQMQAFFINFGGLSTFFWFSAIAMFMYKVAFIRYNALSSRKYVTNSCFICIFGPFALSLLPFSTKSYGNAGHWCWIKSADAFISWENFWKISVFYLWVIIDIPIILCIYYKVRSRGQSRVLDNAITGRFAWFPLLLIFGYGAALMRRSWEAIDYFPNDAPGLLQFLHAFCTGILGLLVSVVNYYSFWRYYHDHIAPPKPPVIVPHHAVVTSIVIIDIDNGNDDDNDNDQCDPNISVIATKFSSERTLTKSTESQTVANPPEIVTSSGELELLSTRAHTITHTSSSNKNN